MSETPSTRISSLEVATLADRQIVEMATRLSAMSDRLMALHSEIGISPMLEMYDNRAIERARSITVPLIEGATGVANGLTALNKYLDAHPHVF